MPSDDLTLVIQHDLCKTRILTRSERGDELVGAVDFGPDGLVGVGMNALQETRSLVVGPTTMDRILGLLVYPADGRPLGRVDVKGRDAETGAPRIITLTRGELSGVLDEAGQRIGDSVLATLGSRMGASNPVRVVTGDRIPSEILDALSKRGLRVEMERALGDR